MNDNYRIQLANHVIEHVRLLRATTPVIAKLSSQGAAGFADTEKDQIAQILESTEELICYRVDDGRAVAGIVRDDPSDTEFAENVLHMGLVAPADKVTSVLRGIRGTNTRRDVNAEDIMTATGVLLYSIGSPDERLDEFNAIDWDQMSEWVQTVRDVNTMFGEADA